jgi:hypothetical protein
MRCFPLLLTTLAVFIAACSSPSTTTTSSTGSTGTGAACTDDKRVVAFADGFEQASMSGALTLRIMAAQPTSPTRGNNVWNVALHDAKGGAVQDAAIALKPFMIDHGHGSSLVPQIKAMGGGVYEVDNLSLFMPGVWQMTFTITPASGPVDTVQFDVCVDG